MSDEKLFELAVNLVCAKLHNQGIPAASVGQNDMIVDHVGYLFDHLRAQWRERHHEENVHPFSPGT